MEEKEIKVSEEELQTALSELQDVLIPPLQLPVDNLEGVMFDKKSFSRGVSEASYTAGYITALVNVGLSPVSALDYLLNKDTIEHNLKLADKNNETSVKVAEKQLINFDKNQL
jgi:hypothetical protein